MLEHDGTLFDRHCRQMCSIPDLGLALLRSSRPLPWLVCSPDQNMDLLLWGNWSGQGTCCFGIIARGV